MFKMVYKSAAETHFTAPLHALDEFLFVYCVSLYIACMCRIVRW